MLFSTMRMLWLPLITLIVAGCSGKSEQVQAKEDATAMMQRYHVAMEEGGLMAEFEFLDESPEFFWIPPGYNSALKYDSVKEILTRNAPSISAIHIEWEDLEVIPINDQTATFHGIVISTMTDTAGQTSTVRMLESGTLIRRTEGWKLLSGQTRLLSP